MEDRILKFRAWNCEDNEMYFPYVFSLKNGVLDPLRFNKDGSNSYRGDHVMQYTGRKDIKGTEIYEGDICKVSVYDYTFTVVITWNKVEDKWGLKNINSPKFLSVNNSEYRYKIIGNIYETPELQK